MDRKTLNGIISVVQVGLLWNCYRSTRKINKRIDRVAYATLEYIKAEEQKEYDRAFNHIVQNYDRW